MLTEGGSDAEISDLDQPGEPLEPRDSGGLLEVYTRVRSPEGRAAAVRGVLLRRRHRPAAPAGLRLVPARSRSAAARPGRGHHAAAVGAHPPAGPLRPRPRAAAAWPRPTPRSPSAAGSPATCTTASSRTSPARRSRSRPRARPADRRPTPSRARAAWQGRCAPACARCARCWSRSTRPTWASTAWQAALDDLVAPAATRASHRPSRCTTSRAPPEDRCDWCGGSPRRPSATPCGTPTRHLRRAGAPGRATGSSSTSPTTARGFEAGRADCASGASACAGCGT